jgi:hypothetical protein
LSCHSAFENSASFRDSANAKLIMRGADHGAQQFGVTSMLDRVLGVVIPKLAGSVEQDAKLWLVHGFALCYESK